MTTQHPTRVLVLGPMAPVEDDLAVREPRTVELVALIQDMVGDAASVDGPETNRLANIIPGILAKLETADLVVLDLTGASAGVMYELGLVHALGLPYICLSSDRQRPFYVRTVYCITGFELAPAFDAGRRTQRELRDRLMKFLASPAAPVSGEAGVDDFATNPVSEFFSGLPIVDISAPAGLAAGYWRNAVRRFVCHGGYFEAPDRVIALKLAGAVVERPLRLAHFVAVKPPSGLAGAQDDDSRVLRETLAAAGLALVGGNIRYANPTDMRDFGASLLGRVGTDGTVEVIDPGIVIEIPTTLYALNFSPRILRIDQIGRLTTDRARIERLKLRRYDHMLDRFAAILDYYLRNSDNPGHIDKVHVVDLAGLPDLLARLIAAPLDRSPPAPE